MCDNFGVLLALAELRFCLEKIYARPGSRGGLQRAVQWVRRDLCLPLLEAQNGCKVLGRNNLAQRIIYSIEASTCGLIGCECGTVSRLAVCCVFRVFVYLWGRCPAPVADSAALQGSLPTLPPAELCKIFQRITRHADTIRDFKVV